MDATRVLAICIVGALFVLLWQKNRVRSRPRVHLARDALGNEALILSVTFAGHRGALFMIDTAYAGAPVLSTSYLSLSCDNPFQSVETRYRRITEALRKPVTEGARHAAMHTLLGEGRCRAFTSGCTMRLMGIGATSEAQADMLLCPALRLGGAGGGGEAVNADVMVTNPLPGSVHILTSDFLLHRAPCVIRPRDGCLHLRMSPVEQLAMRPTFEFHRAHMVGGAFAVPVDVGGATLRIVVDTGAAAALSIGRDAIARLATCARPTPSRKATQSGVNGERICSDVMTAPVRIGSLDLGVVEIFANEGNVQGADGYAGMGLLRAVDMWLEPQAIGFRKSGLAPRGSDATVAGDCGREIPSCALRP